jgi:hypothetical protein
MNKHKRHLDALRVYLGRDSAGLKLLDAVARDIIEQRKQIASLIESEALAVTRATQARKDVVDAENQKTQIQASLEKERAKLAAAKVHAAADAARIAQLESDSDVEDEAPVEGFSGHIDPTIPKIIKLSKIVRKRFKKIPTTGGPYRSIHLESVVKDFTGDEFMELGMLVAVLALHNLPAPVVAKRTIKDMKGWMEKHTAKFAVWYGPCTSTTPLEAQVLGVPKAGTYIKIATPQGTEYKQMPSVTVKRESDNNENNQCQP